MSAKEVEFHEQALAEAQAAYDWYATRDGAAAEAFIDELDHAIDQIRIFRQGSSLYFSGTRRYVMKRFPFAVIYRKLRRELTEIQLCFDRMLFLRRHGTLLFHE